MTSLESQLWIKRLLIKERTPRPTDYWMVPDLITNTENLTEYYDGEELW